VYCEVEVLAWWLYSFPLLSAVTCTLKAVEMALLEGARVVDLLPSWHGSS